MVDKYVKHYNEERPHQTLNYAAPEVFYEQTGYVEKLA